MSVFKYTFFNSYLISAIPKIYIWSMPTRKPKIFVVHLGCSKNQVDAERLVGEMLNVGFETTETASKADYILVNTCGFIEAAKEESINAILAQVRARKRSKS